MIAEAGNGVEDADPVRPRRKMGMHFITPFYNSGQKSVLLIFQKDLSVNCVENTPGMRGSNSQVCIYKLCETQIMPGWSPSSSEAPLMRYPHSALS